jgi:hypothetical protein
MTAEATVDILVFYTRGGGSMLAVPRRLASRAPWFLVVAASIGVGCSDSARAQVAAGAGAQSLQLDPSVRAAGMGSASAAVFWGNELNTWSNPALLASNRGVRYERGRTRLVPDLADDVHFTTKRVTVGYGGIGLQVSGRPFDGVGAQRLDYGTTTATDSDGNVVGEFSSYENITSFGAAISGLEFAENALRALGKEIPRLSRYGDVSVGWTEKETEIFLAPASVTLDGLDAEGNVMTHDSGVLFRLTPYNSIDYAGTIPGIDGVASLRLDVSHGRSTLSYDDATVSFFGFQDPVLRTHRTGWAVHAAMALPRATHERLSKERGGWLLGLISPLIRWGKAWDRELPMILDPSTGFHVTGEIAKRSGWEVTFANVVTIRRGFIEDRAGTIVGPAKGWALGLQLNDVAGVSYDEATFPQSVYLDESVHRKSLSVFVNPVRLWSLARR